MNMPTQTPALLIIHTTPQPICIWNYFWVLTICQHFGPHYATLMFFIWFYFVYCQYATLPWGIEKQMVKKLQIFQSVPSWNSCPGVVPTQFSSSCRNVLLFHWVYFWPSVCCSKNFTSTFPKSAQYIFFRWSKRENAMNSLRCNGVNHSKKRVQGSSDECSFYKGQVNHFSNLS